MSDEVMTYREYLTRRAMMAGVPWYAAKEAVASTALEHPEQDMDQLVDWHGNAIDVG